MLIVFLLFASAVQTTLQQGLIALGDGKLADARAAFQSVIQQDPKNAFAWVSMAEACRRLGDRSTADDAARKAEDYGVEVPTIEHALAAFYSAEGEFAHAAKLEERYAASAKADPQAHSRTAELYERAGDVASAERVLKAAWERHGADPAIAFSYAQLLMNRLDFVGARKTIAAAVAAHPRDPQLILVSGIALYGERHFPEAMSEFLKVVAIDPAIPQPYQFLGKMLEQAGAKLPVIERVLEARVKAAPDDASANLVLAKAKLAANSADASAEGLLRHSVAVDSTQWEAHYELGVLLEARHKFSEAADELKMAIAVSPKQAMPHYHLARVYDRLGEAEKAAAERKLHAELSDVTSGK